jgi:hypothetical protein
MLILLLHQENHKSIKHRFPATRLLNLKGVAAGKTIYQSQILKNIH